MKRLKIMTIILSMVIFFLGNMNIAQAKNNGKIHKNIYIEHIDVSKLSKDEAIYKIEDFIKENNQIIFNKGENNFILNIDSIDTKYDVIKSVEEAYNIGRNENTISNIKTKIDLDLGNKITIKLKKCYDNQKLQAFIDKIDTDIKIEPIDAKIQLNEGDLNYEKEVYGTKLDKGKFKRIIIDKIDNIEHKKEEIPTIDIKPKYLYEDLIKVNSILGTYETYFNADIHNRVSNIRVGAGATNNIILNPNEEFSFNSYIQPINITQQFKKAPVIRNGKLEDGFGGGICQVSTTLYNAVLYAGLEITTVKNHSIPSSYISKGRDATISTGDIDFKFRNNFETPIFITHKVYNEKIVSTIYGNEECKKDIEIITEIVESVPYKVRWKNSERMYNGEKIVQQKGRKGYTVNTFRIYKGNGDIVKELIRENYYPPMDKIVIYGTKKKIENKADGEVI